VKNTRIIVSHYGGPDALRVVEEECPEPKVGEVRVRMLATGDLHPISSRPCQAHTRRWTE